MLGRPLGGGGHRGCSQPPARPFPGSLRGPKMSAAAGPRLRPAGGAAPEAAGRCSGARPGGAVLYRAVPSRWLRDTVPR